MSRKPSDSKRRILAEHVVNYLGQYTHRMAIINQRILNIADGKITFIAKDSREGVT